MRIFKAIGYASAMTFALAVGMAIGVTGLLIYGHYEFNRRQ